MHTKNNPEKHATLTLDRCQGTCSCIRGSCKKNAKNPCDLDLWV